MGSLPHTFRDPELLALALTHASTGEQHNNERLEFLGDAVLDLIVAEELYRGQDALPEGELTERKAWVVSRRVLAEAASGTAMERELRVGLGMRDRALPRSMLANVYEAVLGAVYLDAGFEAARAFVRATLAGPLLEVRERSGPANPKQELQQIAQQRTGAPPVYTVVRERGSAHAKAFLVQATIAERSFPTAWGRTRKEAERWAAHEALLVLSDESVEPQAAGHDPLETER